MAKMKDFFKSTLVLWHQNRCTSDIIVTKTLLSAELQMATLSLVDQPVRSRAQVACEPIRLRATITIDIEADDYLEAQQARALIEAQFTEIRQRHEDAGLEFRQRRPRLRPRPGAPGPVIVAYADD